MIDEDKVKKFEKGSPESSATESKSPFNWKALPVEVLIQYRDEITSCLPPLSLDKMNLEEEMILQYHAIRALQGQVMSDETIPVNQRAQVANSVASSLNKLAELQTELFSSERFKQIENLLVRTLSKLPEEVSAAFLTEYEKVLGSMNG